MNNLIADGKRIRAFVFKSGLTKERIVVDVQKKGIRFSLSGLDKIFRNEFPKKDSERILKIIASSCQCSVNDFAESEMKSA